MANSIITVNATSFATVYVWPAASGTPPRTISGSESESAFDAYSSSVSHSDDVRFTAYPQVQTSQPGAVAEKDNTFFAYSSISSSPTMRLPSAVLLSLAQEQAPSNTASLPITTNTNATLLTSVSHPETTTTRSPSANSQTTSSSTLLPPFTFPKAELDEAISLNNAYTPLKIFVITSSAIAGVLLLCIMLAFFLARWRRRKAEREADAAHRKAKEEANKNVFKAVYGMDVASAMDSGSSVGPSRPRKIRPTYTRAWTPPKAGRMKEVGLDDRWDEKWERKARRETGWPFGPNDVTK